MSKNLIYLTYQTFPATTANTIQTIDNVKYLSQKGYKVKVLFPLRSKSSSDNINILKDHYEFNEEIEFKGLSHKLPFGKYNILDLKPTSLHQRTPFYCGSKKMVNQLKSFIK